MTAVAAVDAGSNAIRLAMVDVGPTGIVTRKRAARYALRLGGEVFSKGRIASEHVPRLIAVCRDIVGRMQRAGIERYRAVATSAMRDAQNGSEIADVIRRETGLELEIISGAEEGRIMRLTLTRALGSLSSDCLLVDLGGGSVELERTVETGGCSLPLGTVRLLHRYPALQEPVAKKRLLEIGAALRDELATCLPAEAPAEVAIGTGGNLEALARIVPVGAQVETAGAPTGRTSSSPRHSSSWRSSSTSASASSSSRAPASASRSSTRSSPRARVRAARATSCGPRATTSRCPSGGRAWRGACSSCSSGCTDCGRRRWRRSRPPRTCSTAAASRTPW